MEKQKMTIHRALSELKLIDSKIDSQTQSIVTTGIYQKGKLINGYISNAEFENIAKSKFDSVMDLISRKSLIKSAIVTANGNTKLTISGVEMTISDAINYKSVMKFKKALIGKMSAMHSQAVGALNKNNEAVNQNAQRILEATFGKENVKVSKDDVDAVIKPFLENNEFHLFDPLSVDKKVEALTKEVESFEMEVDSALSEINAVTFIEV